MFFDEMYVVDNHHYPSQRASSKTVDATKNAGVGYAFTSTTFGGPTPGNNVVSSRRHTKSPTVARMATSPFNPVEVSIIYGAIPNLSSKPCRSYSYGSTEYTVDFSSAVVSRVSSSTG